MYKFVAILFAVFLFEEATSCTCYRDPYMEKSKCGCQDLYIPCGVTYVYDYPCKDTCKDYKIYQPCGCSSSYSFEGPCFRDTCNVCAAPEKPSPICACLKKVNGLDCGCGCEETRAFIYFPEVEYPAVALDMKPFYYSTCFCY